LQRPPESEVLLRDAPAFDHGTLHGLRYRDVTDLLPEALRGHQEEAGRSERGLPVMAPNRWVFFPGSLAHEAPTRLISILGGMPFWHASRADEE
jgi:hypothetical protein